MFFGANMILAPVLLFGGIYLVVTGEIGFGILAIVLLLPMGIYFRVIMMRRCRDIGWPAFLPWVLLAGGVVISMVGGHRVGASSAEVMSSLATPLIFYLIDFAFMIVIGCMATKDDYGRIFDDDDRPVRAVQPATPRGFGVPGVSMAEEPSRMDAPRPAARLAADRDGSDVDFDRIDAVIAQRLAALQSGGGAPAPAPALRQGAGGGFGRKVV